MKFFTLLFLLFGAHALQSQSFFVDLDADTLKASMFSEPEPNPYHLIRPVNQSDLVYWYFSREEEYRYNELELAAGELPTKMFVNGLQVNRMFTHPIRAWDECEGCVFVTAVPYWVHPVVK